MNEAELERILENHRQWLESGQGDDSLKANLAHQDLITANLHGASLQRASMSRAKLQRAILINAHLEEAALYSAYFPGADLTGAHLDGATLTSAVFSDNQSGADVTDATFHNAWLDKAQMAGVRGLQSRNLAGANVSDAKLPEDIAKWEGLKHVEEISKHARGIFLAVIAACVFSWLTIATTGDAALLLNSATTPLPIIQTNVPIAGFYWFAPVILLALYFYLHFYLQSLWEGLASLPAVFPDGRTLDERAYPWMLNSLVQAHFRLLRDRRPAFSRIKVAFSVLAAWWMVPFTMMLFWMRYLPREHWAGSALHLVLLAVSVFLALTFYARARATLRLEDVPSFSFASLVTDDGNLIRMAQSAAVGVLVFFLTLGAFNGVPADRVLAQERLRTFVSAAFYAIGFDVFSAAVEADLSVKGSGWITDRRFEDVRGAELSGMRLRNADFTGAFLVKADLTGADLQGAFLRRADLRHANLADADLRGAILVETLFDNANLRNADLRYTTRLSRDQLARACVTDTDEQPKLDTELADVKLRECPAGLFLY